MITYSAGAAVRVVGGVMIQMDIGLTAEEIQTLSAEDLNRLFAIRQNNALREATVEFKKEIDK